MKNLKKLIKEIEGLKEHVIEECTEVAKEIAKHEAYDTGEFYNSIFAGDDGVLSDDPAGAGKIMTIEYGSENRKAIAPFRRSAQVVPEIVDKYFKDNS